MVLLSSWLPRGAMRWPAAEQVGNPEREADLTRPCTLVRVCDECNYGSFQGRCVICGGVGISDAYYCKECTQQEKDRDGCPKIVNLGSAKTDLFYERKKYGFKKR